MRAIWASCAGKGIHRLVSDSYPADLRRRSARLPPASQQIANGAPRSFGGHPWKAQKLYLASEDLPAGLRRSFWSCTSSPADLRRDCPSTIAVLHSFWRITTGALRNCGACPSILLGCWELSGGPPPELQDMYWLSNGSPADPRRGIPLI